jgi:hypothetical protein
MRIRLGLLSVVLAGWFCACGPASENNEELGQRRASIVGGHASDESRNSVVVIMRGRFLDYCTGVVVAPRLVLTARHCLFGPGLEETFYENCRARSTTIQTFAWPPEDFKVYVGNAKPLLVVGAGKAIYANGELDMCTDDVALLEVDSELPVAPLALRLDEPPEVGEEGTLVGWGWTAIDEPTLPTPRQERAVQVLAIGARYFERSERYIAENAFAGSEGGCIGDEGAPLISVATNAVIGLQQAVLNVATDLPEERVRNCVGGITIFQRLDEHSAWLRSALRALDAAPWIESKQPPAALGEGCLDGDECLSGLCVSAGTDSYCSVACAEQPCSAGMQCTGPEGGRVCTFEAAEPFDSLGGCSLRNRGARSFPLGAACLAGWALLRLRRHRPLPTSRSKGASHES